MKVRSILLIDAGNSRVKWATWSDGKFRDRGNTAFRQTAVMAALQVQWRGLDRPARVFVSNVVGAGFAKPLAEWCQDNWAVEPTFVQVRKEAFGVRNGYTIPKQLGVDRWLAMIAAWQHVRAAVCIVDCGTAVTIDALDGTGRHLGGLILPGLRLMRQSLSERAHALDGDRPGRISLLATTTDDGIAAGSVYAIVACIERVVDQLQRELDGSVSCVMTGGDAVSLMPSLSVESRYDADLVLHGLAKVAHANYASMANS